MKTFPAKTRLNAAFKVAQRLPDLTDRSPAVEPRRPGISEGITENREIPLRSRVLFREPTARPFAS